MAGRTQAALLGPTVHQQAKVPVELAGRVALAAKSLGISASEWWRRAAAEKLGQTPASSD